ncbi:hypothetical phage protein [Escherichia coli SE11]|uniref:Hypothetical phage protein n=2 Tax=Escherichia coli TaxID=562 RepID=A0A979GH35_ECOSE|nr:hypothetical phage protein [Escherichia coli SE11]
MYKNVIPMRFFIARKYYEMNNVNEKQECPTCGNEAPEYLKECPHCGGQKCNHCDMGDDTACMNCEGEQNE